MDVKAPKNALMLCILEVLKKHSSYDKRLSQKDIEHFLASEHNLPIKRKAIRRSLTNLIELGYDVGYEERTRTNKSGEEESVYSDWYLIRDFSEAELRLLIDSLLFSKYLPYSHCKSLIKKLEDLGGTSFSHATKMPSGLDVPKSFFYTLDILDEAIRLGQKVEFYFTEYGIDKLLHPILDTDGEPKTYKVSPYRMVIANSRHYLLCSHEGSNKLYHYRIDRMTDIKPTKEPSTPIKNLKGMENDLNLENYMSQHIYMYGGESIRVMLRAKRSLIGEIIEWFGSSVSFRPEAEDEVVAVIESVNRRAMRYWTLQFGEGVEVLSPADFREEIHSAARVICDKYEKERVEKKL